MAGPSAETSGEAAVRSWQTLLTGYSDRPSYPAGESVPLRLSGDGPVSIELVELVHGDVNPAGPGLQFTPVDSIGARANLVPRQISLGSYMHVADLKLGAEAAWSFTVWAYLTRLPADRCTVLMTRDTSGGWLALQADAAGRLAVAAAGASPGRVTMRARLAVREWYLIGVAVDPRSHCARVDVAPRGGGAVTAYHVTAPGPLARQGSQVWLGAQADDSGIAYACDAKLEAPAFWDRPLASQDLTALAADRDVGDQLLRWDFSVGQPKLVVAEVCRGANGTLANLPTRGVTGHSWTGQFHDWQLAPDQYAAIHFHSDDLSDAGWPVTTSLALPPGLANGLYAAHLTEADGQQDFVPFAVLRADVPAAAVAVLLPTFTYLAYANEPVFAPHVPRHQDASDEYVSASGMLSQYNWHSDGSGVVFASWLRPLLNLRPDYRYWLTGHPHGIGSDLYLLDWLRHQEIAFDLFTDHDLHREGAGLLRKYRLLITGTHPEYWTLANAQSLQDFLDGGGRLFYPGGNGLAAYVGVHPAFPAATELRRRANSPGLWDCEPGELILISTGQPGGLSRHQRPRARELIGVDISAMGFSDAVPFHRCAASDDPRVAFAFDKVAPTIGDYGLHMGGAAGYEVDSTDYAAGTPAHALVVATADDFPRYTATDQRGVRGADMAFFETPAGGAVFSISSLTWCGSLSHDNYENDVSRLTANVVSRLADPEPFSWPADLESGGVWGHGR
jgi:N,N-dimethylformamidase